MKKILLFVLFFCPFTFAMAQSRANFMFTHSANRSISVDIKVAGPTTDIIYGAGVSYFYNKGNIGVDYTDFILNFANAYDTVRAKEGAIYGLIGQKVNDRLYILIKGGIGTRKKYINGKGLMAMPNELWFVRQRDGEDLFCGAVIHYNVGHLSLSASWDSFNSFGLGIGFNFNER